MNEISLQVVNRFNWKDCLALEVESVQAGFVSSNLYSIAQAYIDPARLPCAICNKDDVVIGFAMYCHRPLDDGSWRISRFMIDRKWQGHGYGRAAAAQIIENMESMDGCDEILLDHAPDNKRAHALWASLGFEPCGSEGDNTLMRRPCNDS